MKLGHPFLITSGSSGSANNSRGVLVVGGTGSINTHALLRKEVDKKRVGAVVLVRVKSILCLLVLLDAVNVGIEQVAGVEWASLGLGVELRAENRPVFVNHALVG